MPDTSSITTPSMPNGISKASQVMNTVRNAAGATLGAVVGSATVNGLTQAAIGTHSKPMMTLAAATPVLTAAMTIILWLREKSSQKRN